MNWEAIGAVGEAVGAAGVIISLLYLAVQIRGDARAKRAATVHAQAEGATNFLTLLITGREVAELWLRGIYDFASLQGAELVRFSSMMQHVFRQYEDQFLQWTEGGLGSKLWNLDAPLDDLLALPGVQSWWGTRAHWYRPQFRSLIEGKIAEGREPTMYTGSAT